MAKAHVRTKAVSNSTDATNFTAQGKVFEAGSKQGLGGLVATFYHVPSETGGSLEALLAKASRLGSVSTREGSGEFSFSYGAEDLPDGGGGPKGRRAVNLLLVISAPEDGKAAASKVLYFTNPPRANAGKFEEFQIGIPREALDKAGIGDAGDTKESLDSYKRVRVKEKFLAEGVTEFHKEEVVKNTADKQKFREQLIGLLATNPAIAALPGEVVPENGNIKESVEKVAMRAVARANEEINDSPGVPVNIYLTPEDRERLAPYFQQAVNGVAVIPEREIRPILFRNQGADNPGTLLVNQNPIAKFCAEQTFEEKCAKEHTGLETGGHGGGEEPGDPGPVTGPGIEVLTNEDIPKFMARLLDKAPSPDSVLDPALSAKRADQATVEKAVDAFALRKGPADVPAFYDFQNLQLAFEHVWKILFDENIVEAGHNLNRKYLAKTGSPITTVFSHNWASALSSVDLHGSFVRVNPIPAEVASQFDITLEEWTDLSADHQSKLTDIARDLGKIGESTRTISASVTIHGMPNVPVQVQVPVSRLGTLNVERKRQDLREQGERLIDAVRHDDYYSMHKTLRDLHDRINSNYEFTVFAADQNTQVVNFGLLNTYRQEWVPVNYQAGRLVKTIPLSPKEERKYSLKITRTLKQVRKEALKNNSSLTYDQSSTSRVEAEIMAKAQSKTNFDQNMDASYNWGTFKGTTKTTFGVEAQKESSESRKDFHESAIKAVQEYKEERTVEIDTEETEGSEYTESGTIVNPNDELSVTYLFYELQRRYRVSEQLHRVMPVVLVAQPMPAPHEITESWVIANDWVINRVLLDNSFRPALEYLANKSVGDDFALRELRKNLRQQRNLVETLRIELSIASSEAQNRYRSLESEIEKRIGEEKAEETDSWFSDVSEFFGGGGESPEAAKARELAAKDAHQYAVEKAEKAAAALRQEMGALHALTNDYNNTLRTHLDNETRVKRLLAHLRSNIMFYEQAIWSMEPPDQRFLRLHKVQVPVLELDEVPDPVTGEMTADRWYRVKVEPVDDIFTAFRAPGTTKHKAFMFGTLKPVTKYKPLVEVADLDSPMGCKGNYMIFPLKEHNALTEFMAAPYVDSAFGAMDPEDLSNISLNDYGRYICCLHEHLPADQFEAMKPLLKKWLELLLADPLRNGDEITVPTNSLFIEILPGAHPLLEDFKLRHRELDVYKVAEEVRKGRLENLRLAARLLNNEREDPDIEKKVIIEGPLPGPSIPVDDPV